MKAVALTLFSCVLMFGQTGSTGSAETMGACSPANTGSNNVFNITCGIGKEKGELMLKILNKILASQLDPAEVMSKLDEILKGVNEIKAASADRRLSESQKVLLLAFLRGFKGQTVTITSLISDPEAFRYAQDFAGVFKEAGFVLQQFAEGAETTGVNLVLTFYPVTGVDLVLGGEAASKTPLAQGLHMMLNRAEIKHGFRFVYSQNPSPMTLFVGSKPRVE